MISRSKLKYYSSLKHKKFRLAEEKFIVEGKKLVTEALVSGMQCELILYTDEFRASFSDVLEQIISFDTETSLVSSKDMERITDTVNPQGVAGVFSSKKEVLPHSNRIILLDNVSDPGNTGTILRNCDWFGFSDVITGPGTAEIYNPKVIRSAMGSVFRLNIIKSDNLRSELLSFKSKGYNIISADLNGTVIYEYSFPDKFVLAFSNESDGPSVEMREFASDSVTIPGKGGAESLNVANASAVILSEFIRRERY